MIEVYTRPACPYCTKAKSLLSHLDVDFSEIKFDMSAESAQKLYEITGGMTYPQIIIHGDVIGGYDDLHKLFEDGELEKRYPQTFQKLIS